MDSTGFRLSTHAFALPLLAAFLVACSSDRGSGAGDSSGGADGSTASQIPTGRFTGTVTETMNAGDYTYVNLERNGESVWAAGPQTEVALGDELLVELAMPMPDFESPTIDRKFDTLYFVTEFGDPDGGGDPGTAPARNPHAGVATMSGHGKQAGNPHAGIPGFADATATPIADVVDKAEGGYRIVEIWNGRKQLVGKEVAVRGEVVKYNPRILGVNWIHLQDGSGDATAGTHDLTVTTDHAAAVGDIVTVHGRLAADRDFGAGYRYELLLEKAKIQVE